MKQANDKRAGGNYNSQHTKKQLSVATKNLLAWYDGNRRALPWRALPGVIPDPYHVWLSEIMCQQTTVPAVIPYFQKFLQKWPDIHSLAAAPQEEILKEWAGLGYYARARNLHACARIIANDRAGAFPADEPELKKLPGIGDYTAAAISAMAFGRQTVIVDANVERVLARYFAVTEPLPAAKPQMKERATTFFSGQTSRSGDLAQALMDLGSSVCISGTPRCPACPLRQTCRGRAQGIATQLPRKAAKKQKRQKYGYVYWITDRKSRVLIHCRPQKGLFGGMTGLPTSNWVPDLKQAAAPEILLKHAKKLRSVNAYVSHSFTHFDLQLEMKRAEIPGLCSTDYIWIERRNLADLGFPTLFKKAFQIFDTK